MTEEELVERLRHEELTPESVARGMMALINERDVAQSKVKEIVRVLGEASDTIEELEEELAPLKQELQDLNAFMCGGNI